MAEIIIEQKLEKEKVLIKDFILLCYASQKDALRYNLIGTNKERKKLKIFICKDILKYVESNITYESKNIIYNIITADFYSRGSLDYLLITKTISGYENILVYTENSTTKTMSLGESTASPFLISYGDCRSSLLLQNNDKSFILSFKRDKTGSSPEKKEVSLPKLHPQHTSNFITVDDKYIPSFCLETFENGERKLMIYNFDFNNKNAIVKNKEIELPKEISPLIFADLNGSCICDLAFVSKENGKYFLNVFYNKNSFDTNTKKIKKELNYECILEEDGFRAGIYYVDLFSDSNIYLALKIKESYVLMKREGDDWTEMKDVFDFKHAKIHSVSFADLGEIGRESLILNYVDQNESILVYKKNNLLEVDAYAVYFTSYDGFAPGRSYQSSLTGITFRITFLEKQKKGVVFLRPDTSHPSLKPDVVFKGIGNSPYLISVEGVGGAFINKNDPMLFDLEIIPNSKLVVCPVEGNYCKLYLCLSSKQNIYLVWLIYFIVFVVYIIVILGLQIREVKKRRKAREQDALFFNFEAL